jgi:hypothetical protein
MSANITSQKEQILKLLKDKSVMKQDVFKNTMATFDLLKQAISEIAQNLKQETEVIDKRIGVTVTETNNYVTQLKVAGDMLEFFMHTNVFQFDKSHVMFKTGYVKQNEYNSYCGIINVYNFLADSFKYNRSEDLGYLVCRIFINREMRFFIEAKGMMGSKYASFSDAPINKEQLLEVINDLIIYVISFDLFTPPFDAVKQVSVGEIQEKVSSINLRIGKRLGYGSSAGTDEELYV